MRRSTKNFQDLIVWQKAHHYKARYMNIAQSSVEECRYYLILTKDLGYGDTSELMSQLEEVIKILEVYTSSILDTDS